MMFSVTIVIIVSSSRVILPVEYEHETSPNDGDQKRVSEYGKGWAVPTIPNKSQLTIQKGN